MLVTIFSLKFYLNLISDSLPGWDTLQSKTKLKIKGHPKKSIILWKSGGRYVENTE